HFISCVTITYFLCFFFSSRRRHTRCYRDWSSDVCSSDLLFPRRFERIRCAPGDGRNRVSASRVECTASDLLRRNDFLRTTRRTRSEERRVGKECRSRWETYS